MPSLTLNSLYTRLVAREYPDSTYSTTFFLEDAHIITQDIWSDIQYMRRGNTNWDIWLADTVALQYEYTYPTKSSILVGADWIESVSVAYQSDTYTNIGSLKYAPCKKATIEQIRDWTRLSQELSKETPIYFESDGSIFIAPDPRSTEVWVNRLQITWVRSNASGWWTTSTTEQETKLPLFLLDTLYYGIVWKCNEFMRRDTAFVQSKYNFYVEQKRRGILKMNTDSSESYETTDMSVQEVESDELNLTV